MTPASSYGLLHTHTGTLVHLDHARRALCHADRKTAPRNIAVHLTDAGAWLVCFDPATGVSQGCVVPGKAGGLAIVGMDQPSFWAVRQDGQWMEVASPSGSLKANAEGGVTLAADGDATRFCLIAAETMRCLDSLLTKRWFRPGGPRHVKVTLDFGTAIVLTVDGLPVDPTGLPGPFVVEAEPVRRLLVVGPKGRLLRLVLYDPVICLTVFGGDVYYQVLSLALQALARFGAYDGLLCIAADRPADGISAYIPDDFRDRWRHVPISSGDGLFARYSMPDWGLEAYQPIVYMDADIAANAPLGKMLTRLAASRRVHVSTEDRLFRDAAGRTATQMLEHTAGNWFGAWLFCDDPRLSAGTFAFGSSGIIAADHVSRLSSFCAVVRSLRQTVDPAMIATYTDQALANYALHAIGNADFAFLDRFVDFARSAEDAPDERRGLVHFHSGVGHGGPKLVAMQRYIAALDGRPRIRGFEEE